MEYKPIQTRYNGFMFRSRREAKWAYFFDRGLIRYFYEPEGLEFPDGTKYLPDFFLPDVFGPGGRGVWVEVKGLISGSDRHKVECLASSDCSNNAVILYDCEESSTLNEFYWKPKNFDGSTGSLYCCGMGEFFRCPVCGAVTFTFDNGEEKCMNPKCGHPANHLMRLSSAYCAAKRARFDHGETPHGI